MGGSIAVTVREEDGTEHRMCQWTNIIPDVLTNLNLVEDPENHVRGYLKEWKTMSRDWKRHLCTGAPCKHNMTEVYAPHADLAPHSYGLVVLDLKEKVILESNGYTTPGAIHLPAGPMVDPETAERFRRFADAGRVKYSFPRKTQEDYPDMSGWTGQQHLDWVLSLDQADGWSWGTAWCDLSPFTIERFQEGDKQDLRKMQQRVLDLGFILSEREQGLWTKFIEGDEDA